MRFFKTFLLMVLASAFLVACGGGGGTDAATGNTNLADAYNKITPAMNYAQVKAIVGSEPTKVTDYMSVNQGMSYVWNDNVSSILGVSFRNNGSMSLKQISSPTLKASVSY
jgi:ABC-type glycerol-3-phosphate transport system substrate-binding protein